MRNRIFTGIVATVFLLVLAPSAGLAEPPLERIVVTAVADADQNRILVRWRTLEGLERYDFYEVLRRDADDSVYQVLNARPIGPLNDVASIEALFTTPGYEDALGWIRETLGDDYAAELLNLRGADPPRDAALKLAFLPDQNYGAAIALGLGFMDHAVTHGETYVYEVWGVDGSGYAVERLGRASAVAGSPGALSGVGGMDCTEPGDQRADMAAFLRWDPAVDEDLYIFGYEVFRRECEGDGSCPLDMGPGDPLTVKSNRYPVLAASPGSVRQGGVLFQANCASCHATRNDLKGRTLEGFRMLQHSQVTAPSGFVFHHDRPELNALSPDSLEKIFDYIHEFRYRDDGDDTESDPLHPGCYCYQVVPRDLLGQLGSPSASRPCEVKDMIPPGVPALIRSDRVVQGGAEICRISWKRNDDTEDGTTAYQVFRVEHDLPRNAYLDEALIYESDVPQPPGEPGDRVTWTDTGQGLADATHRFYYAVRAKDESDNFSPISGWAPCVPRDIEPPEAPGWLDVLCCEQQQEPEDCVRHTGLEDPWITHGGEPTVIADPRKCPPRFAYTVPTDAFRVRVYRSFDNQRWFQGKDIEPEPCNDPHNGTYCFSPTFDPALDQKIWYRLKSFDTSGNLSDSSNSMGAVFTGIQPPPSPQIFEVYGSPLPEVPGPPPLPAMPGRVIIRFRSLKPSSLLGFALYTRPLPPVVPGDWKNLISVAKGDLIKEFPASNFAGTMPMDPEQWILAPGSQRLEGHPDLNNTEREYLWYNGEPGADWYEMAVDIGSAEAVNLQLVAIGWSGKEGPFGGKAWDGWVTGDDELEWPRFRRDVLVDLGNPPDTSFSAIRIQHSHIELEWTADPAGCESPDAARVPRPFIVFRRREDAVNWQQVSPPFRCPGGNPTPPLVYRDYDVEFRTWYRYMVVQLDERGEFTWRRESDAICFYDTEYCESPEPR